MKIGILLSPDSLVIYVVMVPANREEKPAR
jgi:hypothetical protein